MKRSTMIFAAVALSAAFLGACESTQKDTAAKNAAPVNAKCPVGGEAVDSTVTTSFQGQTVAFCCNKCKGSFDKMADADKSAALAKVK